MPVTTDPLTMSQAPSKEYLQGWNDCHKHMAEEIVRQDTQIEQYDLTIRGMTEKNDELREAGRKSADDAASALDLLSRIRFALGDNGTRMQDELLEYCRELRDSAGALAALGEEYDALKGRVEELEDQIRREGRMISAQQGLRAQLQADRDRYRDALAEMSDELSHYPEGPGIFGQLKRILRRALNPTV